MIHINFKRHVQSVNNRDDFQENCKKELVNSFNVVELHLSFTITQKGSLGRIRLKIQDNKSSNAYL